MAKIDYGVDIDMNDNHILNVAVQTVNALPATGVTGKLIYYTVDNTLRYWDGSSWVVLSSGTIPSVLVYKGSCTYAALPSSGQAVGDVWNVTDAHGTTPAGTNYAWDGSAWDPLGVDVDLSNYVTNTSLSTTLSSYAKKYTGTITGDGSTKSFTITHSIGSMPQVQVFDSSGVFVLTKVTSGSSTAVVEFNTAPGSGVTYSVVCVG